jgi:hypothetical protein
MNGAAKWADNALTLVICVLVRVGNGMPKDEGDWQVVLGLDDAGVDTDPRLAPALRNGPVVWPSAHFRLLLGVFDFSAWAAAHQRAQQRGASHIPAERHRREIRNDGTTVPTPTRWYSRPQPWPRPKRITPISRFAGIVTIRRDTKDQGLHENDFIMAELDDLMAAAAGI